MDYGKILKRSWDLVWKLKFLWVFGFLLALTTSASSGWWLWSANDRSVNPGVTIQFDEGRVVRILGEGIVVDFTGDGLPRIRLPDQTIRGLESLGGEFADFSLSDALAILAFAGIEVFFLVLLRFLLRYSSESAIIHSVDLYAEAETRAGFGRAFRLGWSRTALRLFAIDLLIFLVVAFFATLIFLGALAPVILGIEAGGVVAIALSGSLTLMLLIGWIFLLGIAWMGSSLIRQVCWRACGVEGLGVMASIRRGFSHLAHHFGSLAVAWLIWFGVGLGRAFVLVPITILLFPLILATMVAGALAGLLPAVLTWGIANLFLNSLAALAIAMLVALPIFVVVALSPLLFIGGLVRIFQSNIWTLAYRDLPAVPQAVPAQSVRPGPGIEPLPAG